MNREIKFRAWNKTGKMIQSFHFMASGFGAGGWIVWGGSHEEFRKNIEKPYPPQDFEIMQFTGLHDKKGKEIYEGDIIKYSIIGEHGDKVEFTEEVVFKDGCFELEEAPLYIITFPDSDGEIIGNIHQNPELLTK